MMIRPGLMTASLALALARVSGGRPAHCAPMPLAAFNRAVWSAARDEFSDEAAWRAALGLDHGARAHRLRVIRENPDDFPLDHLVFGHRRTRLRLRLSLV